MSQQEIIDKLNVVAFDVTAVSGSISRDAADDPLVFTSGSVRYINPKHLRVFTAARQAANRLCRAYGVRFLSGWAVPDESVEALAAKLNAIAGKVNVAKAELVAHWDARIAEWRAANPAVLPYDGRFPSAEYAERQTGATLAVYRIQPQAFSGGSEATDGIAAEVSGLAGRVLTEIAQDVNDTWDPAAGQASQKIKHLLVRSGNKLRTLQFLGGGLGHMAAFVEQALSRLPVSGTIGGADFTVLAGILGILASPQQMTRIAQTIEASGLAATESLFAPPVLEAPVAEEPQAQESAAAVEAPAAQEADLLASVAVASAPTSKEAWAW